MRRLLLRTIGALIVLGIVSISIGIFGFFTHREQISPLYSLAERAITKGRRVLGFPTETVSLVKHVETTYLTLSGEAFLMPDNDYKNGGALAAWGDDVLVMHKSGTVFYLDEQKGLVKSGILAPDNGTEAYAILSAEEYPGRRNRIETIRFNDIEFIDQGTFRGFLLSYTYIDAENECYRSRISKVNVPEDVDSIRDFATNPEDWELLFETSPCLAFNETRELIVGYMAGGRMAFKYPHFVYLGSGEYHLDSIYRPDAGIQSDDSDYGKTIEINILTGEARHFSKGHRNLQGVALDTQGRLWTTEHGMRGGDELNLIVDGENYGWPLENLGTMYSGLPAPTIGRVGRHKVFAPPVYAWLPSAAVSSLALVEGFHETWDGDLLVGSLKGRTLFRVRIREERIVFIEEIPIGQRIRDVMQIGPDRIALWLDTNELVIFRIKERTDPLAGLVDGLVETGMSKDLASEALGVLVGCNECHSFEQNIHGAGPSLFQIAGQKLASTSFADYSGALQSKGGNWDHENLSSFLISPEKFAEGTAMTGLGVGNAELADAVARALEWLSEHQRTAGEL